MDTDEVFQRGKRPSIVEAFRIEDLYGYRTISLASEFAATILIAKNGSGKTTLLAALDAFLKGQFSRFRDVKFFRIACKLRGVRDELILTREDVLSYVAIKPGSKLEIEARRLDVSPDTLFGYLEDYVAGPLTRDDETFHAIMRRFNYNSADAQAFCDNMKQGLTHGIPAIRNILKELRVALKGVEVVYLPTYRRLELTLNPEIYKDRYGRPARPVKPTRFTLHPGDVQFGLSDISGRLAELNQQILFDSNQGYRGISASIINELIDGSFDRGNPESSEIPDRVELELFFSRLKEGRHMGPYLDVSIPNLEKIYTGPDISDQSNKFLQYFLAKLNVVIGTTRDIEKDVRDFIESCNGYLSSHDPSTTLPSSELSTADDKELRLNRRDLNVYVVSKPGERRIPMDALSSGEKQMISLLAKLFLYPKNKLILIDEPELSLSMEWQKKILVDVVKAPLCSQVIAITHSPFVFDNSLEPFARTISVSVDPELSPQPSEEAGDELHG